MKKKTWKANLIYFSIGIVASLFTIIGGCGKQAFLVNSMDSHAKAGGHFTVPPKVDILLAEDNTGSMYEVYATIAQQMPGFLLGLEAKGWDYHFITTPLASARSLTQVTASKFDSNWGSLWTPAFPGAVRNGLGTVNPAFFRTLDQYSDFINPSDISNTQTGQEPGLEMIRSTLYGSRVTTSGFLRSDAMLVVMVVGNGEDTSGVTFCTRVDGYVGPCELVGQAQSGTMQSSFDYYKNQLTALKANPAQLRMYSAVSPSHNSNCNGGTAYAGNRYMNMALALRGKYYNVCSQPVSQILGAMSNELHATQIAMRTKYLFVAGQPDVSTVHVTKYTNGDANQAMDIPQDATNGWTDAGYLTNAYAIDSPILMNQATGWALELHGTAKLMGDDTADVTFMPFGTHDNAK